MRQLHKARMEIGQIIVPGVNRAGVLAIGAQVFATRVAQSPPSRRGGNTLQFFVFWAFAAGMRLQSFIWRSF